VVSFVASETLITLPHSPHTYTSRVYLKDLYVISHAQRIVRWHRTHWRSISTFCTWELMKNRDPDLSATPPIEKDSQLEVFVAAQYL
jgi:hypothetical protein